MGGSRVEPTASAIAVLCGSGNTGCHGWVESHREEARKAGWLLREVDDPQEVPVPYRGHWALLDDNGLVYYLPFHEVLARGLPDAR